MGTESLPRHAATRTRAPPAAGATTRRRDAGQPWGRPAEAGVGASRARDRAKPFCPAGLSFPI